VTQASRKVLAQTRAALKAGQGALAPAAPDWEPLAALVPQVLATIAQMSTPSLRPVLNATGVLLHTNLGRAPLPQAALNAVREAAEGYSNVELDLDSGERGSRHSHVEQLLRDITHQPAAMVVNNCAAAVVLTLRALARNREVVVSRGELVEIGGSFRLPDMMEEAGATLVEVGTTNRTRIADYARAITDRTALLLKVHRSNFRVKGFTEEAELAELIALGDERGVPVIYDAGSGLLADLSPWGITEGQELRRALQAGPALTMFSGDKLLGGPQAGIIVGSGVLVACLRRHPLARALRVDKMCLAALETVLQTYAWGTWQQLPLFAMLSRPVEELWSQAETVAAEIARAAPARAAVFVEHGEAPVGGGTLPGVMVPSARVRLCPTEPATARGLARALRTGNPSCLAVVRDSSLLLDMRTVPAEQAHTLAACAVAALERAATSLAGSSG
jgi:L-seryl-tRNA(Ser) seleniumtransferase